MKWFLLILVSTQGAWEWLNALTAETNGRAGALTIDGAFWAVGAVWLFFGSGLF